MTASLSDLVAGARRVSAGRRWSMSRRVTLPGHHPGRVSWLRAAVAVPARRLVAVDRAGCRPARRVNAEYPVLAGGRLFVRLDNHSNFFSEAHENH